LYKAKPGPLCEPPKMNTILWYSNFLTRLNRSFADQLICPRAVERPFLMVKNPENTGSEAPL
jgi:hypothetical protein